MKKKQNETPFTVEQITAAMIALGMYGGKNSDTELGWNGCI